MRCNQIANIRFFLKSRSHPKPRGESSLTCWVCDIISSDDFHRAVEPKGGKERLGCRAPIGWSAPASLCEWRPRLTQWLTSQKPFQVLLLWSSQGISFKLGLLRHLQGSGVTRGEQACSLSPFCPRSNGQSPVWLCSGPCCRGHCETAHPLGF